MSKIIEILNEFWTPKFRYKGVNVNFLGLTTFKEFPQSTFKTSVRRLSKKGYIENINNYWYVTKSGQEYLKTCRRLFDFNFPKESPKNLLIIFDIPDARRSDRDWFRKELGKAGYIMV